MQQLSFKNWLLEHDIFGFEKDIRKEDPSQSELDNKPIKQFDTDLMIEYLSKRKLGVFKPVVNFMNEIQWGDRSGAVKLIIAPKYSFTIKKLGFDLEGHSRWVTKKFFQLNRRGFGGFEEVVADEIYDEIETASSTPLEAPQKEYDQLSNLVQNISTKMRRVAKDIFIYEGIKKMNNNNYIIIFGVRGHGLEAPSQRRVEEVLTQVMFDERAGVIRITNYKVLSKVGGPHSWILQPSDFDLFFFPTQDRDEISETIATQMKYY